MLSKVWKPTFAAGVIGAGLLWSVLTPAPLLAGPDLRVAFGHFDRNGDKVISLDEFLSRSADTIFIQKADKMGPAAPKPVMIPLAKDAQHPAATGASPPPERFQRAEFNRHDRNRDGRVTFPEFEAHHRAMMHEGFSSIDRNGNGSLEPPEYAAVAGALPASPRPAAFEDLDANHDGLISEDEFFS